MATAAAFAVLPIGWYVGSITGWHFPIYTPLLGALLPPDRFNPFVGVDWEPHNLPSWLDPRWFAVAGIVLAWLAVDRLAKIADRSLERLGASDETVWISWFFAARRYAFVMQCADVIHACAVARRTGGEKKGAALRLVSKRLKAAQRGLTDAYRIRGSVPRFSHRRKVLKLHARHVSAALYAIESRIDHDADSALKELAETLLVVSDRYCHARLGALLDESAMEGVEPLPDRENLRFFLSLITAAGTVAGLSFSGIIPESAESVVYPLIVASALTVAFGKNVRRTIEVLGVISGGQ
ncbi:hypothetical protein [Streptomyces sp. NPDC096934]|uniref:hypothetical protein n=1 Tax=Streptomyces sp. NPDC096934 TaxID=3155551 RepID=UPI003328EAEC